MAGKKQVFCASGLHKLEETRDSQGRCRLCYNTRMRGYMTGYRAKLKATAETVAQEKTDSSVGE